MGPLGLGTLLKPTVRLDLLRQLRTSAGKVLDQVLASEPKFTPAEWISLLAVYRNLQADPPVDVTAIGTWLQTEMPAEVQLAAFESLAIAGKSNEAAVLPIVLSILKTDKCANPRRGAACGWCGWYARRGETLG